jgi:hypothetical protein
VASQFRTGQRLKPHLTSNIYGTAEAVPYKDLAAATLALKFDLIIERVMSASAY